METARKSNGMERIQRMENLRLQPINGIQTENGFGKKRLVEYCIGKYNTQEKNYEKCGKGLIQEEWTVLKRPYDYDLIVSMCPSCSQVNLASDLEKILSISG